MCEIAREPTNDPLSTSPEGLQRTLLLAVDFEEGVQPGDLKEVLHVLVGMDKLHLASPLPDGVITSNQFTHAIAVNKIHAREIEQEFLVALPGQDIDQVTELCATISQRESPNRINYNDSVEFSCSDLKTHREVATFCFRAELYIRLIFAFNSRVIDRVVSEIGRL